MTWTHWTLENAIKPIQILMEKAQINNIEERDGETSDLPYRLNAPSSAHWLSTLFSLFSFSALLLSLNFDFLNSLTHNHSMFPARSLSPFSLFVSLFVAYAIPLFVRSFSSNGCQRTKQCRKSNNGNKSTSRKEKKERTSKRDMM